MQINQEYKLLRGIWNSTYIVTLFFEQLGEVYFVFLLDIPSHC